MIPLPSPTPTVRDALRAFAALVLDGTPPPVRLEDGVRAVQIAEACRRSAERDGAAVVVEKYGNYGVDEPKGSGQGVGLRGRQS